MRGGCGCPCAAPGLRRRSRAAGLRGSLSRCFRAVTSGAPRLAGPFPRRGRAAGPGPGPCRLQRYEPPTPPRPPERRGPAARSGRGAAGRHRAARPGPPGVRRRREPRRRPVSGRCAGSGRAAARSGGTAGAAEQPPRSPPRVCQRRVVVTERSGCALRSFCVLCNTCPPASGLFGGS